MDKKREILGKLKDAEMVYVIMSSCTHMPYVACDKDTYDDEVFLYFREEDAKKEAKSLLELRNPIQIAKVEQKARLSFYTSLYPMGVNCMRVNKGMEDETAVQLTELITRPAEDKLPDGQVRVENPELHLTAIYFIQEFRKNQTGEMTEELKELNEEMLAHFKRGKYIVAVQEGKGMPVLKQKEGAVYQPLFTDFLEFNKFNKEKVFKAAVVEADKITDMLAPETSGVAINPLGVNVTFQIARKQR